MIDVLIACEFSGVVRDAFLRRGFRAVSCDLLPSESTEMRGRHFQCDVRDLLYHNSYDLVIAHPPCTYLARSGAHLLKDPARMEKHMEAADFFTSLLECAPFVAVENPRIVRKYAQIPKPTHSIQPWQFGHGETKETQLWLHNLPDLRPTYIVEGRRARIAEMPDSLGRAKRRSISYTGIADAMAAQWGNYVARQIHDHR